MLIFQLNSRYSKEGDVAEPHRSHGRVTTPAQDRFIRLNARRLQILLRRRHQVVIFFDTVRRRLHQNNLWFERPQRVRAIL